jgi:hypothetical protein
MFHRHKWIEVERFYATGVDVKRISGCDGEEFHRLVSGVTTIRFRCSICSQYRTTEILGKSIQEPNP